MKIGFAFAAALAFSTTAAAQAAASGTTPTVNGSTNSQSSSPAQAPGSIRTLPTSNMATQATAGSTTHSSNMKGAKDMDKAPTKKTKMKSGTSTTSPQ